MKTDTRQLLRDLKAATLLGDPTAVDLALNGLLAFPGVAANGLMQEGFIEKTILPIGQTLLPLKTSHLRPLLNHPLSAGRAIGAVALANQFLADMDATAKDLRKPANDPRADVRAALGQALLVAGPKNPQRLLELGTNWLMSAPPKPRATALIFIPALAESQGKRVVGLLGPIGADPDQEVRTALSEALNALARAGLAEQVLGLLALWAGEAHPNAWVICHVLSTSWAAGHSSQAESILRELSSKAGTSSQVKGAVEALARHGLEIKIS